MIKCEFHCHTCYSKDSLVSIDDMQKTAERKGLQRIVITDHNNFQGAVKAKTEYPDLFIPGEEILTLEGELLGIFVQELVPPRLSALETIKILRDQGAFISVAHPFDAFRAGSWSIDDLQKITPFVDAIEVFNSRCMNPQYNRMATKFALQHHILGTVGSDAHSLSELGSATLTLPVFSDPSTLKQALAVARMSNHVSGFWVHFYSRYAVWRKKRGAQCE